MNAFCRRALLCSRIQCAVSISGASFSTIFVRVRPKSEKLGSSLSIKLSEVGMCPKIVRTLRIVIMRFLTNKAFASIGLCNRLYPKLSETISCCPSEYRIGIPTFSEFQKIRIPIGISSVYLWILFTVLPESAALLLKCELIIFIQPEEGKVQKQF